MKYKKQLMLYRQFEKSMLALFLVSREEDRGIGGCGARRGDANAGWKSNDARHERCRAPARQGFTCKVIVSHLLSAKVKSRSPHLPFLS